MLCSGINTQLPKLITWEQVFFAEKNALKHRKLFEEEQMPKYSTHIHQPQQKNV